MYKIVYFYKDTAIVQDTETMKFGILPDDYYRELQDLSLSIARMVFCSTNFLSDSEKEHFMETVDGDSYNIPECFQDIIQTITKALYNSKGSVGLVLEEDSIEKIKEKLDELI